MSNQEILSGLDPIFRRKAEQWVNLCKKQGYEVLLTSGYRSKSAQDALYAIGRTKPGKIVTNARGTPVPQSMHCFGIACDFALIIGGIVTYDRDKMIQCGKLAKTCGLEWGGDWKSFQDIPHIQYTQGKTLSHFQNGGTLDPVEPVMHISGAQKIILLTKRWGRTVKEEAKRIIKNVIERLTNRIS